MHQFPKTSLILGGAASGKSAFAESLTRHAGLAKTYLATARAEDDDMADKIKQHRQRRGSGWHTVESPVNLAAPLREAGPSIVLLDCLTLWLSNLMFGTHDIASATDGLQHSLTTREGPTILVSNDVGSGITPDNQLARQFQRHQGRLNQTMAQSADLVVLVTAGLPLVLKGQLPKGFP